MSLVLFDSVQKKKIEFQSQEKNKVKIYVCGPTVYDDSHLGHARSAIVFDLLHRILIANSYEVTMVKNFTDIDDKIIKKMAQSNQTLEEITSFYIDNYKNDMDKLNILPNTIEPLATNNIKAMQELTQKLLDKNLAYILDDGVYLDTSKDEKYGIISHRASDENSIARVESHSQKKDPKDFVLWKFIKDDEYAFEDDIAQNADTKPLHKGRPGWHCECSAMINTHLADKNLKYAIDIHGGGMDLLFPHHENEATQTRLAYSQEISKYWVHNGFVNINGKKMSKSLGNSFFLKDVLDIYNPEVVRFYMFNTYYRSDLGFNNEDLLASKKRLDKIYRLKKRVYAVAYDENIKEQFCFDLLEALNDDMNTSKALAIIDKYISQCNESLNQAGKHKLLKKQIVANLQYLSKIMGIGYQDSYKYFQFGISDEKQQNIQQLIQKRDVAKQNKDFELSDKLRDEISSLGISTMDTPNGTVWEISAQS